jgi:uncharacterized protein (TIGR02246 family)
MVAAGTVRQEIERIGNEFGDAFGRGDPAAIAAHYAEDGMIMPPGGQAVKGRQGIEQFWRGVREMGVQEVSLTTEEVDARDDLAYEVGSAVLKIQPPEGAAITDTVKYVVVWKRDAGGAWQLYRDIWNSNGDV